MSITAPTDHHRVDCSALLDQLLKWGERLDGLMSPNVHAVPEREKSRIFVQCMDETLDRVVRRRNAIPSLEQAEYFSPATARTDEDCRRWRREGELDGVTFEGEQSRFVVIRPLRVPGGPTVQGTTEVQPVSFRERTEREFFPQNPKNSSRAIELEAPAQQTRARGHSARFGSVRTQRHAARSDLKR